MRSCKPETRLSAWASSGVHSNGFSLVRKVFNISSQRLHVQVPELGKSLGEELLTPTRIYVKPLLALMDSVRVHAISPHYRRRLL